LKWSGTLIFLAWLANFRLISILFIIPLQFNLILGIFLNFVFQLFSCIFDVCSGVFIVMTSFFFVLRCSLSLGPVLVSKMPYLFSFLWDNWQHVFLEDFCVLWIILFHLFALVFTFNVRSFLSRLVILSLYVCTSNVNEKLGNGAGELAWSQWASLWGSLRGNLWVEHPQVLAPGLAWVKGWMPVLWELSKSRRQPLLLVGIAFPNSTPFW
jgi:hypothetical protein